jgi:cytochrome oxidase Cu insertion factor (SCO1/SenC/PrrC family)
MSGASRLAAVTLPIVLVLAGCTGEELGGVVRDEALEVGAVALPDVTPAELRAGGVLDDGALVMRAAPDRLLLVYFGFLNCPDICPTTLADMRSALRRLNPAEAARIDVAFVTVDPDRDMPTALAEYLAAFLPRFHAVRADADALAPALEAFLARAEVTVAADGEVEVAHSAVLYAVDDGGTVVVEWPFGTSATTLTEDLRVLLGRAA